MFYILIIILFLGVIQGIIGTIGVCPGLISPIVVGYFTLNQVIFLFINLYMVILN